MWYFANEIELGNIPSFRILSSDRRYTAQTSGNYSYLKGGTAENATDKCVNVKPFEQAVGAAGTALFLLSLPGLMAKSKI